MMEVFDRIENFARSDDRRRNRIRLVGGRPSMPDQQHEHIKTLVEQHTAQRRESDRAEARRRGRQLLVELEKSLPADVPLHKRGFGVMEKKDP
jgi:hypothetical protein